MRDIRFRGLNRPSREWKYGFVVRDEKYVQIWQEGDVPVPVDHETVGEWTGLVDKNGGDIYEGDFVSDGPDRVWEVRWRSAPAGFGLFLHDPKEANKPFDGRLGRFTTSLMDYQCEKLEVVGNMYENPDLITSA